MHFTSVPFEAPATISFKLWQFNFEGGPEEVQGIQTPQGCSLKGRPKTCDITDKIRHYLATGFQHEQEPVVVQFFCPPVPAGAFIGPFCVNFIKGASRIAAALLVAEMAMVSGVSKEQWDDRSLLCLESLVFITARYTGEATISDLVHGVTLLKQRASATQRMDIIQLINVFGVAADQMATANPDSGKEFRDWIIECINIFNRTTTVRNCKIEGNERQAVANLYSWGRQSKAIVRQCWNDFKVKESPITVSILATNFLQKTPPVTMSANWKAWMEPTTEKMPCFLERKVMMYHAKLSQFNAAKTNRSKLQSAQFKERLDDDAFFLCMCWGAWETTIKRQVSPARWEEITSMFYRGTLDEVILGEMRRNSPRFHPEQFSFLRTADTVDVFVRAPVLNLESQRALLEAFKTSLNRQQNMFNEWKHIRRACVGTPAFGSQGEIRGSMLEKCGCWLFLSFSLSRSRSQEMKSQADFYAWNMKREEIADQIIGKHLETRFPVLALHNHAAVLPAVGQALHTFAVSVGVDRSAPLRIFVANLSYVGSAASSIHVDLCSLLADLISQSPATSCAIAFHSNVLPSGVYFCFPWNTLLPGWCSGRRH